MIKVVCDFKCLSFYLLNQINSNLYVFIYSKQEDVFINTEKDKVCDFMC
jgi:hypothetical protein